MRPARSPVELLALGEVMLRLDPGEGRISTARSLAVSEGGGEYNAARALSRTFGRRTGVLTALVDDPVGHLVEGLVLAGGVDTSRVRWVAPGGADPARTGLNFVERGFGVRGARGVSDRTRSAAARMTRDTVDWEEALDGVGWLHTGGVLAGLSPATTDLAEDGLREARRRRVTTSYDVNHRPSLWEGRGGAAAARVVDLRLAGLADVVFGALQLLDPPPGHLESPALAAAALAGLGQRLAAQAASAGRPAPLLVSSWRRVVSAGVNDWSAVAWGPGSGAVLGPVMPGLAVLDRIGSGDALAAGVVDGILTARAQTAPAAAPAAPAGPDALGAEQLAAALAAGVAAGALTMTTPGDTCAATRAEVAAVAAGGGAHVQR